MLGKGSTVAPTLGQLGSVFIEDTDTHTGSFGMIQALTAASISTLVSGKLQDGQTPCMRTVAGSGTLTNVPLPVGSTIYGYFTSIKLGSGKVVAYVV